MGNYATSDRMVLELEVKDTPRINVLKSPVPMVNASGDNNTINPRFLVGNIDNADPEWNVSYSLDDFRWPEVNSTGWTTQWLRTPEYGHQRNDYLWGLHRIYDNNTGQYGLRVEADSPHTPTAEEFAQPAAYTTVGAEARPGEEWSGSVGLLNGTGVGWGFELWAYNGETPLIPIAEGGSLGNATVANIALTPANTTNVRWHWYASSYTTVDTYAVHVSRFHRTHAGWTANRLIAVPATWAVSSSAYQHTGLATSDKYPVTAGQWAAAAVDIGSVGSGTFSMTFWNASNVQVGSTVSQAFTKSGSGKNRYRVEALIPAGATQASIRLNNNGLVQWDAAVLITGPDQKSVGQTGFRETAGTIALNKIVNPSGASGSPNGWTPSANVTATVNNTVKDVGVNSSGIQLNFANPPTEVFADERRIGHTISAFSNVIEVTPNHFVAGNVQLGGQGYSRMRYEWMDINNVTVGWTNWSPGRYAQGASPDQFTGYSTGTITWDIYLNGDIVQVPANAYRARMHLDWQASNGMPFGPYETDGDYWFNFDTQEYVYRAYEPDTIVDRMRFRNAAIFSGATVGSVAGNPVQLEAAWINVFNNTTTITIDREPMEPGVLTAVVKDATIDPSANVAVRPDAKVRLRVKKLDGTWVPLYIGTLDDIIVDYPQGTPRISIRAIDNHRVLFNERDAFGGVSTINALNTFMVGSDVPWVLQASDSATATKTNALNVKGINRGEQIILTRDTTRGYAFISKEDKLVVRAPEYVFPASANQILFSDKVYTANPNWQTYTMGTRLNFNGDDVINSVTVTQHSIVNGADVETKTGPVTNGTSINEWGLHTYEAEINAGIDPTVYANTINTAHASPGVQMQSLRFPVLDNRDYGHAIDLELCDIVDIEFSRTNHNREYRVNRLVHRIAPGQWEVEVELRLSGLLPAK